METLTMSRKEAPRPGLVKAALAGQITNQQGANALGLTARQFHDARTTERTDKKGGKVAQTITRVVSQDGKTMTATVKGTNAQGQAVNRIRGASCGNG
jgi:hypothetical protein